MLKSFLLDMYICFKLRKTKLSWLTSDEVEGIFLKKPVMCRMYIVSFGCLVTLTWKKLLNAQE